MNMKCSSYRIFSYFRVPVSPVTGWTCFIRCTHKNETHTPGMSVFPDSLTSRLVNKVKLIRELTHQPSYSHSRLRSVKSRLYVCMYSVCIHLYVCIHLHICIHRQPTDASMFCFYGGFWKTLWEQVWCKGNLESQNIMHQFQTHMKIKAEAHCWS